MAAQDPTSAFAETIDVNLVNLEARVTLNGVPVDDLQAEDFEILDDGVPITLSHFRPLGDPPAENLASSNTPTATPTAPDDLMLAVLVDNAFIAPAQRQQVLRTLSQSLEPLLAGGSRIMLAIRNEGLSIEQPFTSDGALIQEAVLALGNRPGLGTQVATRRTNIQRQIRNGARQSRNLGPRGGIDYGRIDATSLWRQVESYSQDLLREVRLSTAAIRILLESLAGVPGRKAVLYVCDRLPLFPGETMIEAWYAKYGLEYASDLGVSPPDVERRKRDAGSEIKALIAEAGASRVAFFPLVSGASATKITLETSDASSTGLNLASSQSTGGDLSANRLGLEALMADAHGLEQLAHGTGGATATGSGGVDNLLSGLNDRLSQYYSLAYPAPHHGDGKTHEVEIRVRRDGVKVSYPRTYRDKNPDQEMISRTLATLLLGSSDNPLGVQVVVGEPKAKKGGLYKVPLEVKFPLSSLALIPRDATHVGNVSIILVVRDDKGELSDPTRVSVPVEIANSELLKAMASTGRYRTELLLRAGEQALGIGFRDGFAATHSTLRIPLQIGKGS
jgi:VWFA-related protein